MAPLDLDPYSSKEKEILISPNGSMVTTWGSQALKIWNTDSGAQVFDITTGSPFPCKVQFSPDSTMIALMSDWYVAVWNISSKTAKRVYYKNRPGYNNFRATAFSPNSQYLATMNSPSSSRGGDIIRIRVLDIISGKSLVYFKSRPVINAILTFSSNSKRLAISFTFDNRGVRNTQVEIWDIASASVTNAIVLYDTCFSNIIKAQIRARNYFDIKKDRYFDPDTITFSDNNHLILSSKRLADREECQVFNTRQSGKTYKGFNIKVILTINQKPSLKAKQKENNLQTQDKSSYSIDPSGSWITLDAERLIWLPPEYRLMGTKSYWDARHNCVAISNSSKSLFLLKFCCSICPRQMTPKSGTITECTSTALERHKYTYTCNLDDDFDILKFNMVSSDNVKMKVKINKIPSANDKKKSRKKLSLAKVFSRVLKAR